MSISPQYTFFFFFKTVNGVCAGPASSPPRYSVLFRQSFRSISAVPAITSSSSLASNTETSLESTTWNTDQASAPTALKLDSLLLLLWVTLGHWPSFPTFFFFFLINVLSCLSSKSWPEHSETQPIDELGTQKRPEGFHYLWYSLSEWSYKQIFFFF